MTQLLRQTRLTDDDWLGRLVTGGDREAFAVLYERYRGPLYRYCRSILWNDADAHDAVQSTFTRALEALQENQRDAPVRPWLFRIAHNEAISQLRRSKATKLAVGHLERQAKAVEDPSQEREELGSLFADLMLLPQRARAAIVLRELIGLSHEEIAVALGTTPSNAKHAIFEARRALTEFARGRQMDCLEVRRAFADNDHRTLRSRRVRAHLRSCAACARFAVATSPRSRPLHALAPLLSVPGIAKKLLAAEAQLEMAGVAQGPLATAGISGGPGSKFVAGLIAAKAVTATGALVASALAIGMGHGLDESMQPAATTNRSDSPAHGATAFHGANRSMDTPTAWHSWLPPAAPEGVRSSAYPLSRVLLGAAQTGGSPGSAVAHGANGGKPSSGRARHGTTGRPDRARFASGAGRAGSGAGRADSGAGWADSGAGRAPTEHRIGAGGAARGRPDPAIRSNPGAGRRSSAGQMRGSRVGAGGAPHRRPSGTTNHGRVTPGNRAGGNPSNRAGGDSGSPAGGNSRSRAGGNPGNGAGNRGRGNSPGGAGVTNGKTPAAGAPAGRPVVTSPAQPSEPSPSAAVPPSRSPEPGAKPDPTGSGNRATHAKGSGRSNDPGGRAGAPGSLAG